MKTNRRKFWLLFGQVITTFWRIRNGIYTIFKDIVWSIILIKCSRKCWKSLTRNDSIQIEIYNSVKDTFDIKWESNFEYILTKTRPKNELDSTPFHVKITGFENDSYTFKASYKGSKYIQKGKAIKLKD